MCLTICINNMHYRSTAFAACAHLGRFQTAGALRLFLQLAVSVTHAESSTEVAMPRNRQLIDSDGNRAQQCCCSCACSTQQLPGSFICIASALLTV